MKNKQQCMTNLIETFSSAGQIYMLKLTTDTTPVITFEYYLNF